MKKIIAAALTCFMLAGCQTPQEIAAADDATCQGYGAKQGSNAYVMCRSMTADRRAQGEIAQAQRMQAANAQVYADIRNRQLVNTLNRPSLYRPPLY